MQRLTLPTAVIKRQLDAVRASGVVHCTIDPEGPGVVRLHLVPPQIKWYHRFTTPYWMLLINGWHSLLLTNSEAFLMKHFMETVTQMVTPNSEASEELQAAVVEVTCAKMHRLFPKTSSARFEADLWGLLSVVISIARNEQVKLPKPPMKMHQFSKFMGAPTRMDLIVSPMRRGNKRACPLDCGRICYAMQEAMDVEPGEELNTEQWYQVIDKCWHAGIPQITFTGGEPLMRSDLVRLVTHAERFITRVNTSGVLMTFNKAHELKEAALDSVQITLYSYDEHTHNTLVGSSTGFERTIAGIKNALAAGLQVSVNTPLLRVNADYVNTLRFLKKLGVIYVTCSGLIPAGKAPDTIANGETLTNEEMFVVLQHAKAFCDKNGMDMMFTSPGWLTQNQFNKLGLNMPVCGACTSNMAITPTGAVVPCQSWLNDKKGLGNILTDSWSIIWNSKLCRSIRKRAAHRQDCPLSDAR